MNPSEVKGPRLVLNLTVPPAPADLTAQPHLLSSSKQSAELASGAASEGEDVDEEIRADDAEDEYDETKEKWQYLRCAVQGVFDFRLRLPKGLQHRNIPEVAAIICSPFPYFSFVCI